MKNSKILLALAVPALLFSCSEPELPYELEETLHTFAISVSKDTQHDLLLAAGQTTGDYVVTLSVPEYMGDYKSYFKEAELLCVYTPKVGDVTSTVVATGITELPKSVTIDMAATCAALGIPYPAIGDKMQFTANIIHNDGKIVPGWSPTMGFNYRNPTFTSISYCATFSAAAPLQESYYAGGNTVMCTESLGTSGEASYGANIVRLASSDIPESIYGTDFTADDYIGLKVIFDWYGWGYDCEMLVYINKKDYSVVIPDQAVKTTDEEFYYYSIYPYIGTFNFSNIHAELDTQTNILSWTMNAGWQIPIGTLSWGVDAYQLDFSTVL